MSIARNLFVGREPLTLKLGSLGLLDREKMAKIIRGNKRVELDLRSGDELVESFRGERQGVVIARALYFRTKVLIMDEPTNHLSVKAIKYYVGLRSSKLKELPVFLLLIIFITSTPLAID